MTPAQLSTPDLGLRGVSVQPDSEGRDGNFVARNYRFTIDR